ncbi:ABC transporter permease [Pseudorhodobacter sp. W20_MBD10_FR17]|uniref:ABC transporter permease n=1 Tax=Pseudorhodobacter sp. W20_MBD10_FR17 TaxID=3240266 RepID=UPI003F97A205
MDKQQKSGLILALPATLYVALLIAVPVALTITYSFWIQDFVDIRHTFSWKNYTEILSEPLYRILIGRSVKIAALVTLLTVLTAYPIAYFIAFRVKRSKAMWLFLVTIPFWTS